MTIAEVFLAIGGAATTMAGTWGYSGGVFVRKLKLSASLRGFFERYRSAGKGRSSVSSIETLEARLFLSTSVLQRHNDNSGTGQDTTETVLNANDVNSTQFGQLFSTTVDGQVYAQPLYVSNLNITTGAPGRTERRLRRDGT